MARSIKTLHFEDLPTVGIISIDVEWSYFFDPGKLSGPPESCYPAEEEKEIEPVGSISDIVMNAYILAARRAIKQIETGIEEKRNDLPEWAREEAEKYRSES